MYKSFLLKFGFFIFISFFSFSNFNLLQAQSNQNTDELLAIQYFNNGEFDKAVELFEKIYRRNPSLYFYNYYFESLLALEELKKAERLVEGLIRKHPDVFRYQVDLGLIHLRNSDLKKAESVFNNSIRSLVATEANYMSLAQYFNFRTQVDWAKKTFEFAITKLPDNVNLRFQLAHFYFVAGQNFDLFEQLYFLLDNTQMGVNSVQQRLLAYISQDRTQKMIQDFAQFALRKSQRSPQNTFYSEMLLWAYIQLEDYEKVMIQAIAIDRRQNLKGKLILDLIPVLLSNNKFDSALEGLNYVISLGEKAENFDLAKMKQIEVRFLKVISVKPINKNELLLLESEKQLMIESIGYNLGTLDLQQNLAKLRAFYLNKPNEAIEILNKSLKITRLSPLMEAQLKMLLADIKLVSGYHWDASLLYSQIEKDFKNDTIGFAAKFKNAKFFYYIGEFQFALTHLNILRSATSKLIANDAMELSLFISNNIDSDSSFVPLMYYSRADFLYHNKNPQQALQSLDSLISIFPRHIILDDAYMLQAKIFYDLNEFEKSALSLEKLIENYYYDLLADDALFMLGEIYFKHLNRLDRASEIYWKLLTDFPSSVYVSEARLRYREIRDKKTSS